MKHMLFKRPIGRSARVEAMALADAQWQPIRRPHLVPAFGHRRVAAPVASPQPVGRSQMAEARGHLR